jgi:hypothetical protein
MFSARFSRTPVGSRVGTGAAPRVCHDEAVAENPRLDAFKAVIAEHMRSAGRGVTVTKQELVDAARERFPEHFDDNEPCYPNCGKHPAKWVHLFDRAIYDLRQARPPKLRSARRRGEYELA